MRPHTLPCSAASRMPWARATASFASFERASVAPRNEATNDSTTTATPIQISAVRLTPAGAGAGAVRPSALAPGVSARLREAS